MHKPERCACADCRAGDALPERLQGWPGAYQIPLFGGAVRRWRKQMPEDPVKEICREACAEFGDPPCFEIWEDQPSQEEQAAGKWLPCEDCLRACGIEVPEPIDPTAAVRPLL